MVERESLYRFDEPDVDAFDENTDDHQIRPYIRQSARADGYSQSTVPLFLSDGDAEPYPDEYVAPLKKRKTSISSKILAVVCAAAVAAVLVALFSSDATQSMVVNIKASMAAIFPAASVAAQADPSRLTVSPVRAAAVAGQAPAAPNVTTGIAAAVPVPAREEIKLAYQNALQGMAPATAPVVAEPATTEPAVHHLDPDAITALLKRADALIASGDVAAARLVLRRAADAGDARAAMMVAETYDPAILGKLGVHGVVPDIAMARSWYEKAKTLGSAEATQRLEVLASRRQ
jgi:hypothetical protein